jgi:D-alanyl-D-alanine carboxypeptidase
MTSRILLALPLALGLWLVGPGQPSRGASLLTADASATTWLRTVRETALVSGPIEPTEHFTVLPPGAFVEPIDSATNGRILVFYPGDGATRLPGKAWVATADVAATKETPPWIATSDLDGNDRLPTPADAPRRVSTMAPPQVTASEVAVLDDATGLLLYGRNTHTRQAPASTTKLVTAMVALDLEPSLDVPVSVTVSGWAMAEADGSSVMGLTPGVRVSLRTLLFGLLLPSGNDAAEQLARSLTPSRADFLDRMNAKVAELGLENTHFVNPSGLDAANHFATAYDLAHIARAAMRDETLRGIVATPSYTGDGFVLRGHNPLLGTYPGVDGVKTGTTDNAGQVLIASATRDAQRVFVVVMHSSDRAADASALLNWAWSAFHWEF